MTPKPDRNRPADTVNETVLVPAPRSNAGRPKIPAVTERLRFGPGVPGSAGMAAVAPVTVAVAQEPAPEVPAPSPRRTRRVLSAAFTAAVMAFVVWFLWPSGPLAVRGVSVRAVPATVSCGGTADVIAAVTTNGNPGTLSYRWNRGDGQHSTVLRQTLGRGQRRVDLHLSWTFNGPGFYSALAQVQLLEPAAKRATLRFTYRCSG